MGASRNASRLKSLGLKARVKRIDISSDITPGLWGYELILQDKSGHKIGRVDAQGFCSRGSSGEWARIGLAELSGDYRGVGLYPEMLKSLRDFVQKDGCEGIVSYGWGRESGQSTASWKRFSELDPRVKEENGDYYLSALPRRGRIPLATVRRAMKSLGRKVKSCGITPAALRLGMEIEREHRDVTRGGMTATAKIAAAHLCEAGPGYYKGLKALERRLKRTKRK